jgi:GTP-binding protein LepA
LGLKLIPAINKIDLPNINIKEREDELVQLLGFKREDILKVSGKTGEGVKELLNSVIEKCPPPKGDSNKALKALIFDSFYDEHKGVVVAVRIFDGKIKYIPNKTKELYILQMKTSFKPTEIGIFIPTMQETNELCAGDVGYIATGFKDITMFTVGDTISDNINTLPLPGYKVPKPNVYATFFPTTADQYEPLKIGLSKLSMNDAALTFSEQRSNLLGTGFRCGFLGLLHMEIVQERLEEEYDVSLIVTAPTVEYKVVKTDGTKIDIQTPQELPDPSEITQILEPWVRLKIMTPSKYMGAIMEMCQYKRGEYVNTTYLPTFSDKIQTKDQYIVLEYDIPLASLVSNFFDMLKNKSSGYASMEYEFIDFFLPVDLLKFQYLLIMKKSQH